MSCFFVNFVLFLFSCDMLILIFTVARLFTAKIAEFYENYYKTRGVKFVKGNVLTSFERDPSGKVDGQFNIFLNSLSK
jgi:hypothetical protein